jgi:hypothetical protein
MNRFTTHWAILFIIIFIAPYCVAYEDASASAIKYSEHTYQLAPGTQPAKANLQDVNWLVGSWTGTAFSNQFEEVWNPESANTMVGMFKLYDKDKGVSFYELMLLIEDEGSLSLLVKHFNEDFSAWEEKEDFVTFKLVKMEPNAVHFTGLSFYQRGVNNIDGYIVLKYKDGSVKEEKLSYERVK